MDGNNETRSTLPANKRRRARKACIPCRQRKRKCDGASPCEMCSAYGYTCLYDEDDSPLAPFVAQPAKRAKTFNDVENAGSPNSVGRQTDGHADSPMTVTSSRRRPRSLTPNYDSGILDENKSRYVGFSSAIAFPRVLGLELKSKNPPPLHSFGYNFGIRAEELSEYRGDLRKMVTEEEVYSFSDTYFTVLGPIFDLCDMRVFNKRVRELYAASVDEDWIFSAVVAGAVAVGSFLSTNQGHAKEREIVQYAKRVLEDPASTRRPSVDQVVGWSLRTIYLRATTRPNNSWLSSCTNMHMAEALGLHDEDCITRLASTTYVANMGHCAERLRKIFWLSYANHVILSHEYGRSHVKFPAITCKTPCPITGSYAHLQIQLSQIVPFPDSPWSSEIDPTNVRGDVYARIRAISEVHAAHPFITLTKADLIFCFYRKLRQLKLNVSNEIITVIVAAGNEAVDAAINLVKESRPFWNILGSVFQFTCVLLAIDTPASLASVTNAFRGLKAIVGAADTRLTREALATARLLLRDTVNKKRQDLAMLEEVDPQDSTDNIDSEAIQNIELPPDLDLNLNWDQFFSESYALTGNTELMGPASFTNGLS